MLEMPKSRQPRIDSFSKSNMSPSSSQPPESQTSPRQHTLTTSEDPTAPATTTLHNQPGLSGMIQQSPPSASGNPQQDLLLVVDTDSRTEERGPDGGGSGGETNDWFAYDRSEPMETRRANLRLLDYHAHMALSTLIQETRRMNHSGQGTEGEEERMAWELVKLRRMKAWKDFENFKMNHYPIEILIAEGNFDGELEAEARVPMLRTNLAMVWGSLLDDPNHISAKQLAWAANMLVRLAPEAVWDLDIWDNVVLHLKTWAATCMHSTDSSEDITEEDCVGFFPDSVRTLLGRDEHSSIYLNEHAKRLLEMCHERKKEILGLTISRVRNAYPWDAQMQESLRAVLIHGEPWLMGPSLARVLESKEPPQLSISSLNGNVQQEVNALTAEQAAQFIHQFKQLGHSELAQQIATLDPIPLSHLIQLHAMTNDQQQQPQTAQVSPHQQSPSPIIHRRRRKSIGRRRRSDRDIGNGTEFFDEDGGEGTSRGSARPREESSVDVHSNAVAVGDIDSATGNTQPPAPDGGLLAVGSPGASVPLGGPSPIRRKREQRKKRKAAEFWTADEIHALEDGLDRVQGPHWVDILKIHGPNGTGRLARRTNIQLKDKARVERAKREDLNMPLGVYRFACTYYASDPKARPWVVDPNSVAHQHHVHSQQAQQQREPHQQQIQQEGQ
ncbi:uncharacterized protein VTP21DRAFT_10275 [Calcarisporiella thermophila]|uniref:uncharacterized protein n=1 Tax=Calcarisporiella thermophila TaxID=911321 RepID=UPI003742BB76